MELGRYADSLRRLQSGSNATAAPTAKLMPPMSRLPPRKVTRQKVVNVETSESPMPTNSPSNSAVTLEGFAVLPGAHSSGAPSMLSVLTTTTSAPTSGDGTSHCRACLGQHLVQDCPYIRNGEAFARERQRNWKSKFANRRAKRDSQIPDSSGGSKQSMSAPNPLRNRDAAAANGAPAVVLPQAPKA